MLTVALVLMAIFFVLPKYFSHDHPQRRGCRFSLVGTLA